MSCVQAVQQSIYPASSEGEGDAGDAPLRAPQSVFLQPYDGGDPGSDRGRNLSGIQKKEAFRDGEKIEQECPGGKKVLALRGNIVYNRH